MVPSQIRYHCTAMGTPGFCVLFMVCVCVCVCVCVQEWVIKEKWYRLVICIVSYWNWILWHQTSNLIHHIILLHPWHWYFLHSFQQSVVFIKLFCSKLWCIRRNEKSFCYKFNYWYFVSLTSPNLFSNTVTHILVFHQFSHFTWETIFFYIWVLILLLKRILYCISLLTNSDRFA